MTFDPAKARDLAENLRALPLGYYSRAADSLRAAAQEVERYRQMFADSSGALLNGEAAALWGEVRSVLTPYEKYQPQPNDDDRIAAMDVLAVSIVEKVQENAAVRIASERERAEKAETALAEAHELLGAVDRFYQVNDGIPPLTLLKRIAQVVRK